MSNPAASFVKENTNPCIQSSPGSKHGDLTTKEHQTKKSPSKPFALSLLPSPPLLDKETLERSQSAEQAVKDAVIESLEDDDIDHTSVEVKIDVIGTSFYADVQIITDDAADMGDNPSEQLDYISYAIVQELGGGLIKSITGRVRTTDEVKQDEAMSRRIEEGVVKEEQHNLKNMAVSETFGDVTNTPTKPSAKATTSTIYPAVAPTPEKQLALDEGSHVVNYKPPVFSTIPNNNLQGLHISISGTYPYEDGVESFMGVDKGKGEIMNAINNGGGTWSDNVTDKTHILVIGHRPGRSKVRAATKKEIPIIDLESFHQLTTGSITIEVLRERENAKPTSFSRVRNAAAAKKSKKKSSTSTKKRKRDTDNITTGRAEKSISSSSVGMVVTPKSCGTDREYIEDALVEWNDSDNELEDDKGLDDMEHLCVGYFQSW